LPRAKKIINKISRVSHIIGGVIAAILMFLTTADVIGRYVFNQPITGTLEVSQLMMVVMVFFAFAYVESENAHVRVDLVVSRLSPRVRAYLECIVTLIGVGVFAMLAWQSVSRSLYLIQKGDVTGYLRVPVSPFLIIMAFGCMLLCLQLILRFLRYLAEARGK
jgi:TRAP-type C4-dicarboxylate transport system permease small subunit